MYSLTKQMCITAVLKAITEEEYKHTLETIAEHAQQYINLDGIHVE